MRDRRQRAGAQHLRQRRDQKAGVARRGHAGDRGVAEAGNEVQIDQLAQHDHDHAGEDLRRHRKDVTQDRALREVLHVGLPVRWAVIASSGRARAQTGSIYVTRAGMAERERH